MKKCSSEIIHIWVKGESAMKNRKSANHKLATEQFEGLNKHFYSNYPSEYFLNRFQELVFKLSSSAEYAEFLNGKKFSYREVSGTIEIASVDKLQEYAKIELEELHIHCLETFMRIFISRATLSSCDWISIADLSIINYHKYINKFSENNFDDLNDQMDSVSVIKYALTGSRNGSDGVTPEVISVWREWIVEAAKKLKDIKVYNAFKHGLAVRSNISGIHVKIDEDLEIGEHGDVIEIIEKHDNGDRYVWQQRTEFLNCDRICVEIYLFGNLIHNMIQIGKYIFLKKEIGDRWYPNEKFTIAEVSRLCSKKTESSNDILPSIGSVTMELLYYK